MTKKYLDQLTYKIMGAAIEVHKELGPGLLESVYHQCLKKEFELRRIDFLTHEAVNVNYKGLILGTDLRYDFLVEDSIVVELKATDGIAPVHIAQLMTYMKLVHKPKGILVNFYCDNLFRNGQKTIVNKLYRDLPDE
jgi:GxxExxY protein